MPCRFQQHIFVVSKLLRGKLKATGWCILSFRDFAIKSIICDPKGTSKWYSKTIPKRRSHVPTHPGPLALLLGEILGRIRIGGSCEKRSRNRTWSWSVRSHPRNPHLEFTNRNKSRGWTYESEFRWIYDQGLKLISEGDNEQPQMFEYFSLGWLLVELQRNDPKHVFRITLILQS